MCNLRPYGLSRGFSPLGTNLTGFVSARQFPFYPSVMRASGGHKPRRNSPPGIKGANRGEGGHRGIELRSMREQHACIQTPQKKITVEGTLWGPSGKTPNKRNNSPKFGSPARWLVLGCRGSRAHPWSAGSPASPSGLGARAPIESCQS